MASIKRYSLNEQIDFPVEIVGISCYDKIYRLAWLINRDLQWHFRQINEPHFPFSLFQFYDRYNRIQYSLVQNKEFQTLLVPEIPEINYFLFIYSENQLNTDALRSDLRKISSILAVFPLKIEDIPSIKNKLSYFIE